MSDHRLSRGFFKSNPPKKISAAQIEYTFLSQPDILEKMSSVSEKMGIDMDGLYRQQDEIQRETDPEMLLTWMRRDIFGANKIILRRRALEFEEAIMPLVKRRLLTSFVDSFIENAVRLFVHSEQNTTEWIIEHFNDIRNPYAQSMLCLVLGFRADEAHIPWLLDVHRAMKNDYPGESFDQGPLLALYELNERFQLS